MLPRRVPAPSLPSLVGVTKEAAPSGRGRRQTGWFNFYSATSVEKQESKVANDSGPGRIGCGIGSGSAPRNGSKASLLLFEVVANRQNTELNVAVDDGDADEDENEAVEVSRQNLI